MSIVYNLYTNNWYLYRISEIVLAYMAHTHIYLYLFLKRTNFIRCLSDTLLY